MVTGKYKTEFRVFFSLVFVWSLFCGLGLVEWVVCLLELLPVIVAFFHLNTSIGR